MRAILRVGCVRLLWPARKRAGCRTMLEIVRSVCWVVSSYYPGGIFQLVVWQQSVAEKKSIVSRDGILRYFGFVQLS